MLGKSNLMAFVATKNAAKARTFYEDVLGLKFVAEEPNAVVFDSNGTMLRVSLVQDFTPHPFTVLGWQVADIQKSLRALVDKGVNFERFVGFDQDKDGIWHIPDGTQVAWFKDADGNLLSLTQFAP